MMRAVRVMAVAAAVAVVGNAAADAPGLKQGDRAVDVVVKMATGEARSVKLSELRGKYVLLVVMSKGCEACEQDLAVINDGYRRLAGNAFTVLGVLNGSDRSETRKYVKAHGVAFPIGYDEEREVHDTYGVQGVPTSFLIDPQGIILSWSHGSTSQFKQVEELLGTTGASDETVAGTEGAEPEQRDWLGEAVRYYRRGELKKAYARCRRAIEVDPKNMRAYVLLGDIYRKANKPEQAVGAYREAVQLVDPEDYATIAAGYERMAGTYVAAKMYAEAATIYETAVQTIYEAAERLPFYGKLGLCYSTLGKRKKALAAFDKFFKLYAQVDAEVQRRHAGLYKSVEARQKLLREAADEKKDESSSSGSSELQQPRSGMRHG